MHDAPGLLANEVVEVGNEVVSDIMPGMAVWMRVKAERMAPSSWPGKEEISG